MDLCLVEKNLRFNGLKSFLQDVKRVSNAGQLLALITWLGVDTAHNLEEASQRKLYGAFIIILLFSVEEAQEAFLLFVFLSLL